MKKYSAILMLASATLPSITFALFCPGNYNIIKAGMTIEEVTSACGKPDAQTESIKKNDDVPQEWTYPIPQTVNMGGTSQSAMGTLKTSVMFDDKGKVNNISVNGIGVGSTSICGSTIQLNDDKEKVKSACGTPTLINKSATTASGAPPVDTKVTTLNYNNANPPMTLTFENGMLVENP